MASEDPTGAAAVVTLTADTRPYEKALDKAEKDTNSWGKKVADGLGTINLFESAGRFDMMKNQVESLGKLGLEQVGQKLGGGLGAGLGQAAGMAFGGPFGATIGNFLGGTLGEQIGGALTDTVGDALKGDTWLRDVNLAGGRIGEILGSGWGDPFAMSFDEVMGKAQEKAGQVWEEVKTLALKSLFRVTEGIDWLWSKVQQPFAAVLNWTQQIAVKLGLVEEGTGAWGDAILNAQDVGRTMVGAVGYGLGYLEGLFIKLGGVIGKHLIAPLTTGLGTALQVASAALSGLVQDPKVKLALAAAGVNIDDIAGGLGRVGDTLSQAGAGVGAAAAVAEQMDPTAQALKRQQDFLGFVDAGKEATDKDKPPPSPPPPPPPPPVPLEGVKAILADSREAANLRARSLAGDNQLKAIDKLGKQGEENAKQQQTMIDLMRDTVRHLSEAQVVKPF